MDSNILETIDMKVLGRELQQARVRKGLTQEQAANILDVARTTMTAIEKGDRRVKAGELIKLAHAYDLQMADFLHAHPNIEWPKPQFRGPVLRTEEDNILIDSGIEMLERLSLDYLEIERIVEAPLVHRYPQEYIVGSLSAREAAESIALEERVRLGLGDGQIPVLRDILEQDVGLRIFYYSLPSKFSAIYLYEDHVGGCIAINSNHPEERRRWSLAHEYGHFLIHRKKPTVSLDDGYQRKPESEQIADGFARYFLMPTNGIIRRFNDIRRSREMVTPADLCSLAHYYGVSVEAMTYRLESLKLLPIGTWEKLKTRGFKVRDAQKQLGLEPIPAQEQKFPSRYQYLVIDAFDRGLISEGMLARFLAVDRLSARSMMQVYHQQVPGELDAISVNPNEAHPPSIQEDALNG
jgi:Zn-dependent peptidase ImmA (M78 family)/DNA-binding XRE family transcriptional regulator